MAFRLSAPLPDPTPYPIAMPASPLRKIIPFPSTFPPELLLRIAALMLSAEPLKAASLISRQWREPMQEQLFRRFLKRVHSKKLALFFEQQPWLAKHLFQLKLVFPLPNLPIIPYLPSLQRLEMEQEAQFRHFFLCPRPFIAPSSHSLCYIEMRKMKASVQFFRQLFTNLNAHKGNAALRTLRLTECSFTDDLTVEPLKLHFRALTVVLDRTNGVDLLCNRFVICGLDTLVITGIRRNGLREHLLLLNKQGPRLRRLAIYEKAIVRSAAMVDFRHMEQLQQLSFGYTFTPVAVGKVVLQELTDACIPLRWLTITLDIFVSQASSATLDLHLSAFAKKRGPFLNGLSVKTVHSRAEYTSDIYSIRDVLPRTYKVLGQRLKTPRVALLVANMNNKLVERSDSFLDQGDENQNVSSELCDMFLHVGCLHTGSSTCPLRQSQTTPYLPNLSNLRSHRPQDESLGNQTNSGLNPTTRRPLVLQRVLLSNVPMIGLCRKTQRPRSLELVIAANIIHTLKSLSMKDQTRTPNGSLNSKARVSVRLAASNSRNGRVSTPLTRPLRPFPGRRQDYYIVHPEVLPDAARPSTERFDSANDDERRSQHNNERTSEGEERGREDGSVSKDGVDTEDHCVRSQSGEYVTVNQEGDRTVVQWNRIIRTPTPSVYGVGSTLFSTTRAKLSACSDGLGSRLDAVPVKILVKYMTPDQIWVLIGTLGSDRPFQKLLAEDVTFDELWREFRAESTYHTGWKGAEVERTARFRFQLESLENEQDLLKALRYKVQMPVDWDLDWAHAYREFKALDSEEFPFECT
ncbi:hypothetical protein K435DRAFT_794577 [Dendrothele bispora CBS 962.96]|uniref:F-box domain-containing protein n=1 Tax=Dendrothele bispora (strain CBS 962.96) TaxID=1314807 RepID=A0A4S8MBL6_DENBC|nr:hypothetical protein K435DRAFT_794577 [Dendrothele bispora CBS 962.96]